MEIHDLEDGWAVHLAATGDHDGDDGGRSEWLVLVDTGGTVVDLERV